MEIAVEVVRRVHGSQRWLQSNPRKRLDPGFNPKNVLVANLRLPFPNDPRTGTYLNSAARTVFTREVLRRVRALPGVESAAIGNGNTTPLSGFTHSDFAPKASPAAPPKR
jgi:hypothetical protein